MKQKREKRTGSFAPPARNVPQYVLYHCTRDEVRDFLNKNHTISAIALQGYGLTAEPGAYHTEAPNGVFRSKTRSEKQSCRL